MIRVTVLAAAVTLSAPQVVLAAPLDDAIALVQRVHPVLQAQHAEYRETTRQRDWSSDITLGWTERGTAEGGAAGANAGIRVTIPLFDRSHELRTAEARSTWMASRDGVLTGFLASVAELEAVMLELHEAQRMRAFRRDRLEYQQRQVEEGIAEPDSLWPVAEAMEQADLLYAARQRRSEAMREHVAREFGGGQWTTLRDLLADHARQMMP
ncbi:hypothetical protein LWH48_06570 [Halomonas sp. G15]|uniref:hypothetical protein n=1 Tax=Halomonas sp. G15 TaxID=2903521 RepID=UPI001E587827|nr:hypothetical protein [Halomonas sp. G15]MCE0732466.1 hypothetical protein [Halomonas sp. G15]